MEEDQILTPSSTPDTKNASPPPIASILSDPAMLARIGSIISSLQTNTTAPTQNNVTEEIRVPPQSAPDGLTSVLSDPTLMEKLPQIITAIKPLLDAGLLSKPTSPASEPAVAVSASAHTPAHDRDNLLLSLKPFLSSGRRDAVDAILRIEKLGALLKQIK